MKGQITQYEWDVEVHDEHGDIIDHLFQASYADCVEVAKEHKLCEIILVRDQGTEDEGLDDRQWAQVKDGKFTTEFHNGVPQRFKKEVERYHANQ
jgi:hypothetical protein